MGKFKQIDKRQIVENPSKKYPFKSIVKVFSSYLYEKQRYSLRGCGVIINPRIILTAAYNVRPIKGNKLLSIEVEPETQERKRIPVKWIGIHKIYLDQNSDDKARSEMKIAILILEENYIITPAMTIPMSDNYNFQTQKEKDIIISGYLNENQKFYQKKYQNNKDKKIMFVEEKRALSVKNKFIQHQHFIQEGYGGTPLILKTKDNNGYFSHTMIGIQIGYRGKINLGLLTTQKSSNRIVELAQSLNIKNPKNSQQVNEKKSLTEEFEYQIFLNGKRQYAQKNSLKILTNYSEISFKQIQNNKQNDRKQQYYEKKQIINQKSRLSGHFAFRTNEVIVHNIEVNGQFLYYEPHDGKTTIGDLSKQYAKFTGMQLKLTAEVLSYYERGIKYSSDRYAFFKEQKYQITPISIPKDKLLTQIIYELKDQKVLEKLLNVMQTKDYVMKGRFAGEHIELLKRNYNQMVQKKQIKQKQKKGWVCEILIKHYQKQSKVINYKAYFNTTIAQVIRFVEKKIKKDLWNVQIFDQKSFRISRWHYYLTFSQLKIEDSSLVFFIPASNCFFKSNSMTLIKRQNIILKPIKDFFSGHDQKQKTNNLMSYNIQKQRLQQSQLSNCKQVQGVFSFVKISIQIKQQLFEDIGNFSETKIMNKTSIQCSRDVMFLTQKKEWVACFRLQIGNKILYCSNKNHEITYCPITQIQFIEIDVNVPYSQRPKFYALSSEPHRNLIINGILCHNRNSVKIKVYQFKHMAENQKPTQSTISIFRDDIIKSKFPDKACWIGGVRVSNKYTFGDYQIDRFGVVFITDQHCSCIKCSNQLIFSELDSFETYYQTQLGENFDQNQLKKSSYSNSNIGKKVVQWKNDYLAISQQRIVSIKLQELKNQSKFKHLLIDKRGNLELLNYLLNIEPRFSKQQNKKVVESISRKKNCWQDFKSAVQFYTSQCKSKQSYYDLQKEQQILMPYYQAINSFLRRNYSELDISHNFQKNQNYQLYNQYLSLTAWINLNIQKIKNYSGTVYRGIQNIDIGTVLKNSHHETMILHSFTSTSKKKQVAQSFMKKGKIRLFITIKVRTGKQLEKQTSIPGEQQVLIPPFSYFHIVDKNEKANSGSPYLLQTLTLEQIPLPITSAKHIIFWVDDNPENNIEYANNFREIGIEVVEVTSTKIMQIILKKFFWIYKLIGKQVLIISDMTRLQNGKQNYIAGIDLFNKIYQEYGLSNKGIIFTGDSQKAKKELAKYLKIPLSQVQKNQKWLITINPNDLQRQVLKTFQLEKKKTFCSKFSSAFDSKSRSIQQPNTEQPFYEQDIVVLFQKIHEVDLIIYGYKSFKKSQTNLQGFNLSGLCFLIFKIEQRTQHKVVISNQFNINQQEKQTYR